MFSENFISSIYVFASYSLFRTISNYLSDILTIIIKVMPTYWSIQRLPAALKTNNLHTYRQAVFKSPWTSTNN